MAVLERDYRIDGIKWLLIVLVTFGHVIEPALSNPIANKLYSIIPKIRNYHPIHD